MNKTRKRFTALLITLAAALVLVLSLGIFCACGANSNGKNSAAAWLQGETAPTAELGKEGDHYFDTETLTAYTMKNGEWVPTTLYKGTGAPDPANGEPGDLYLDTANHVLYERGESVWSIALNLKGEKGRDGVIWFSGNDEPGTIQDAQAGDFYLQNGTFDVYQLQADGEWLHLGAIKGDKGDDAEDPAQFYDGNGAPSEELTAKAKEGDLYLGIFDGDDDKGAGFRLYRFNGTDWDTIMESITKDRLDIYTYEQLISFATKVSSGTSYEGKEVHLKTNIDFHDITPALFARRAVNPIAGTVEWTPIGTEQNPFKGTFDGEGHIISNFTAKTTDSAKAAGFFGYVDGATIEHLHFEGANVTASGEGSVGAVVVGQAKSGGITVKDVTVATSTVTKDEGATTGSLVGNAEGPVTVEKVDVEVTDPANRESGEEDTVLVGGGSGDVTFQGENVIEYPIADGFIEKHYKNGEETTVICEITSLNGLKAFRDSVNGTGNFAGKADTYAGKTVKLMTDIYLERQNWTPIGKNATPFAGNFDGGEHTIFDLYVDAKDGNSGWPCVQYLGLFGKIYTRTSAVTIKDLTLENVTIKPDKANGEYSPNVGAFFGDAHANGLTLSGLRLQGTVSIIGGNTVGGIAGSLESEDSLTISNVSVDATNGTITSNAGVGGIVCTIGSPTKSTTMENVTVAGVTLDEIPSSYPDYGYGSISGVVSSVTNDFTLKGATLDVTMIPYNVKSITNPNPKDYTHVGAVIGEWTTTCSISNVKGEATFKGPEENDNPRQPFFYNGGLTGVDTGNTADSATITDCTGLTVNWYGLSYNLANKTWSVSNVSELEMFASLVNGGHTFEGETVVLTADVDLKEINWTPIGSTNAHPFMGTFMGGKITDGEIVPEVHTISNLTIKKTGTEEGLADANDKKFAAFFAFTQGDVTISDLHFVKANVTNSYSESDGAAGYCAVLVGRTNGGNLEIKNVTIGEKFGNTEADKLAHAKETPYVTSGKAVAAFVSRSTGGGSITFDNCINYANLCAPKAAGFIAQFESSKEESMSLTITNSANYGNITMPLTKEELCYSPDVVMGGFIGYIQSSSNVLLVNCVNEGDIDATITQVKTAVGKLNVGGLISSVHDASGKTTLVDCINRGNIVVNQSLTEGTACDGEIGGLIGSTGATMYHVESLGDITVTNTSAKPMHVGGVVGSEDDGVLYLKNRAEYTLVPVPERGSSEERYSRYEGTGTSPKPSECSNIVYCDIIVTSPDSTVLLGGVTGLGHSNDTIDSTFVSIYAIANSDNLFDEVDSLPLAGMSGSGEYVVKNSVLHLGSSSDRGFDAVITWDAEGN